MTGTDELRRLLDERGVAHSDHYLSTTWRDEHGIRHLAGEPMADGSLVVDMLTPEQAIAATLGNGTCEMEYIDTYEYPDGEEDYLCKCSKCGRKSWEPAHNLPKFCGGCGRMVKR